MNKFNLSTYFTLVSRDIIKDYSTHISNVFSKGKIESGEEGLAHLVISTLSKCIGEDIYLIEIADKILTL